MDKSYLGYPVKWVSTDSVFYNDDTLYYAARSIREGETGWWSPPNHPNHKYLHQTGTVLRNTHGSDYSASDHFRTRHLYKNLKASIERDGLQAPLVTVRWHNVVDVKWTIPATFPVWKRYWNDAFTDHYWRTIQGGSRLFVLKDLEWDKVPVIDITKLARRILKRGKCPAKVWVYSKKGRASREAASSVGFNWDKAHSENLYG
jgi:hypothetical protein